MLYEDIAKLELELTRIKVIVESLERRIDGLVVNVAELIKYLEEK